MQPFIRDIRVENYRALRDFAVQDLRWVNIIGGLNGTGKSTLLEAIFTFMDALGPMPILRPLMFRSMPGSYGLAKSVIFDPTLSDIKLEAKTQKGLYNLSFKWEPQSFAPTNLSQEQFRRSPADTGSLQDGVTGSLMLDGRTIMTRHYTESLGASSLMIRDEIEVSHQMATASYLSRSTITASDDISRRYSFVAQSGRKRELLEIVKSFSKAITNLELLQFGNQTVLHAEINNGQVVPATFLGDGTTNLISVSMAIMECANGAVLLDEFDAAIHHSKLPFAWEVIKRLSSAYKCQIFSATHSREAIEASASVFSPSSKDFRYIRINSDKSRGSISTSFNQNEVIGAVNDGWEIR